MSRLMTALVAGFGICVSAQSIKQGVSRWDFLGSTTLARTGACAIRLSDGRLLIAGGGPPGASRGVDLIDSASEIQPAALLSKGRARHSCAQLPDGRVLVTGGNDASRPLDGAEVYDPAKNEWSAAANMTAARMGHTSTVLADGRVLIAGGEGMDGVLDSLEVFDPATGAFSRLGTMSVRRKDHAAALLSDGKILIAGGANESGPISAVDTFDPTVNVARREGQLTTARAGLSATTLPDGTVLLAGGMNGFALLGTAEIFDPATGKSVETATMSRPRAGHLAFALPGSGEVLLAGGDGGAGTAELYLRDAGTQTAAGRSADRQTAARMAAGGPVIRMAPPGTGSATLDQCANGSAPAPGVIGLTCLDWVNGNLNSSKASYREGDSVAYRLRMSGLTVGVQSKVTIEWDTTQSGKHALDYLTRFNAAVTGADPCFGGACGGAPTATYAMPVDPNITDGASQPQQMVTGRKAAYLLQNGGQYFSLWGGAGATIDSVTVPLLSGGYTTNSSTRVTIAFTPQIANPVLSWGGHIATRVDWGSAFSAVAISGSPFHTRLIDLNGGGGNQDRALSSDAATFPSTITITKATNVPASASDFTFTASPGIPDGDPPAPVPTFPLPVDVSGTLVYSRVFDKIFVLSGTQTYTVSETGMPANWTLQNVSCTKVAGTGSVSVTANVATINVQEGDSYACTFTNAAPVQVTVTKACDPTGDGGSFTLKIGTSTKDVSCTGSLSQAVAVGASITAGETALGNYSTAISCTNGSSSTTSSVSFTMPNANVTCTVTNTRKKYDVTVTKACVPADDVGKFILTVNGSGSEVGCVSGSVVRQVTGGTTATLTEAAGTGTDLGLYTTEFACTGIALSGTGLTRTFTMPDSAVSCTVTNRKFSVTITKACDPIGDGGSFTLNIGSATKAVICGGNLSQPVGVGTSITVGETGAALGNYTTGISCSNGATSSTTSVNFTMPNGNVTCTVTNTRKSYNVTVTKACVPSNDQGKFVLSVNSSGSEVGCSGFVEKLVVGGTTVTLTEANGTGTNLGLYVTEFACTGLALDGTGLTRTFTMPDSAVSCTVTNRKPGVTITKACKAGLNATLSVTVSSTGEVCNTGGVDLTGFSFTDVQTGAGVNATGTVSFVGDPLAPGACRNYTSTFTPTQASSGSCATGDATCSISFSDNVTVRASGGGIQVTANNSASCPLCK
ncbi:MAG: hypothetical protein HYX27_16815 [Acidobacteria bacterium]|nr:hypothetical protein [Acidobacteriota bacterium]